MVYCSLSFPKAVLSPLHQPRPFGLQQGAATAALGSPEPDRALGHDDPKQQDD